MCRQAFCCLVVIAVALHAGFGFPASINETLCVYIAIKGPMATHALQT